MGCVWREFVPVDRAGDVEAALESTRAPSRCWQKGISITTFVEGTRSRDGRLQAFKKGPFYLGMESGAPCVPISISGTESMMRKGSFDPAGGGAGGLSRAGEPAAMADRDALMLAVREAIASGLPEWMRSAPGSVT
jgi:1-acyl-sn-glycerol-3-phosphate acyltransferase